MASVTVFTALNWGPALKGPTLRWARAGCTMTEVRLADFYRIKLGARTKECRINAGTQRAVPLLKSDLPKFTALNRKPALKGTALTRGHVRL